MRSQIKPRLSASPIPGIPTSGKKEESWRGYIGVIQAKEEVSVWSYTRKEAVLGLFHMGLYVKWLFLTYSSIQKPLKRPVFYRCSGLPGCKKPLKLLNSLPTTGNNVFFSSQDRDYRTESIELLRISECYNPQFGLL